MRPRGSSRPRTQATTTTLVGFPRPAQVLTAGGPRAGPRGSSPETRTLGAQAARPMALTQDERRLNVERLSRMHPVLELVALRCVCPRMIRRTYNPEHESVMKVELVRGDVPARPRCGSASHATPSSRQGSPGIDDRDLWKPAAADLTWAVVGNGRRHADRRGVRTRPADRRGAKAPGRGASARPGRQGRCAEHRRRRTSVSTRLPSRSQTPLCAPRCQRLPERWTGVPGQRALTRSPRTLFGGPSRGPPSMRRDETAPERGATTRSSTARSASDVAAAAGGRGAARGPRGQSRPPGRTRAGR
jgi:hypothetical protein